jgi:16S rRNA U1498 N3-methylase RsmE
MANCTKLTQKEMDFLYKLFKLKPGEEFQFDASDKKLLKLVEKLQDRHLVSFYIKKEKRERFCCVSLTSNGRKSVQHLKRRER